MLLALLGIALVQVLFYMAFRASGPGAVKFGTLHYLKTFWPVLAVCATISLWNIFEKFSDVPAIGTPHNKPAREKVRKQGHGRARNKR